MPQKFHSKIDHVRVRPGSRPPSSWAWTSSWAWSLTLTLTCPADGAATPCDAVEQLAPQRSKPEEASQSCVRHLPQRRRCDGNVSVSVHEDEHDHAHVDDHA